MVLGEFVNEAATNVETRGFPKVKTLASAEFHEIPVPFANLDVSHVAHLLGGGNPSPHVLVPDYMATLHFANARQRVKCIDVTVVQHDKRQQLRGWGR